MNCSFEHDLTDNNVFQQSLIFAGGCVSQLSGHFQIANKEPNNAFGPIVLFDIGETKQIYIDAVCPKFYRHITEFNSKLTNTPSIQDLKYKCIPCTDNYYTIATNDRIFSIDGENMSHSDDLIAETPSSDTCRRCPYGGHCTGYNVLPRPNYWGYWHEGELVFQQCPAGYCCSGSGNSICDSFDYCEDNRTGTLCGACQEGFSVSILTGVCTPNSECGGDQWFWLFAILSTMAYALWYTFKDQIFHFIFTTLESLQNMCQKPSKNRLDQVKNDQQKVQNASPSNNVKEVLENNENATDKGYFGIITYYVQMAAVMKIQIEFSDVDKSESFIDITVNNVGQFLNLELTKMSFDVCPIIGLTTFGKLLYSLSFLIGIYISWTGILISILVIHKMFKKHTKMKDVCKRLMSFKASLVGGIIEIIKYTYAGFCGIIFMSLVCTKTGSHYVWWYDGSNTCLENWQVIIIIFAIVYAIPFPFILIIGLKLLKQGKISAATFVCCCLFPLVALWFIFIYKYMNQNITGKSMGKNASRPQTSEAIISVLQGPYRDDEKNMTLYWEAMVSIRRLLITSMTLVPYASIRMIIITALSLIFLIQQIYKSPFQVPTSNDVETVSLALLCMTSVINLLKASLTDSGVVPSGPSVQFFKSLEFCEKIFVLFIISFILVTEFKLRKKKRKENVP